MHHPIPSSFSIHKFIPGFILTNIVLTFHKIWIAYNTTINLTELIFIILRKKLMER